MSVPNNPNAGTFVKDTGAHTGKPYIKAVDLGLKTVMGPVYEHINVDVHRGQVVALRGRSGSGKTALLLTLSARMKYSTGSLTVGEFTLPKENGKAMRHVGLSLFEKVNELQDSLTCAYALSAEFQLFGRKPSKADLDEYLRKWYLSSVADVSVKDLTAEQHCHLGIALSMVGQPEAIVIDDIEDQMTLEQSEGMMNLLIEVARELNVAVVVGVVERRLAEMADAVVYLSKEGE